MKLRPTHGTFADSVDHDQTAQNVQSDRDLRYPMWRYFSPKISFELNYSIFTVGLKVLFDLFIRERVKKGGLCLKSRSQKEEIALFLFRKSVIIQNSRILIC